MLTQAELKDQLAYDPRSGAFKWLVDKPGGLQRGTRAGYITDRNFRRISVFDKEFRASHLAWLYVTGELPEYRIKHIDGNTLNDRFENLQEIKRRKGALSGTTRSRHKWQARIIVKGKRIALGSYDTEQEAHQAYLAAEQKYRTAS